MSPEEKKPLILQVEGDPTFQPMLPEEVPSSLHPNSPPHALIAYHDSLSNVPDMLQKATQARQEGRQLLLSVPEQSSTCHVLAIEPLNEGEVRIWVVLPTD